TADGIQVGAATVAAAVREHEVREHEVVTVVRPEEVELAAGREALSSGFLAHGVVDEVLFSGAQESLRVRLEEGAHSSVLAHADGGGNAALQVTRTRHEQRGFEVRAGARVAVGVRRLHVLPTPLSSFTACAATPNGAVSLSRQALLVELAARMKTRIALRVEPRLGVADAACEPAGTFVGTTVIAPEGDGARRAQWLLQHGVKDLLLLPEQASAPQRVLIHWMSEAARGATLGISASVLRHIPAEAVYVGILPAEERNAPHGMRALLDARSEAQAAHGLEIRTELGFGDVAEELAQRLAQAPAQMLIVGITEPTRFSERFGALLDRGQWPVLIVLCSAS
ncbi:MAG: universal stress protein, partial [Gammaproteobacteria bacterium]|nr:universal stress protein [Gammaproteobacteria bacterium]